MWYFSWILGVLFACSCGIINAMWVEMHLAGDRGDAPEGTRHKRD